MAGRFAITGILGAGAFAVVCAAHDRQTGQEVALKVLRAAQRRDPSAVDRLVDEGRILQALDHPNLPRCLERLSYGSHPVLVLERVGGRSLASVVRRGPMPVGVALAIGAQLVSALRHGWEAPGPDGTPMRVVHRDLKPENALLTPRGVVKLVDFGIAKGAFAGRKAKSLFVVRGSAAYDAPERRGGAEDTERVDIYGLGALLLTLVSGHAPVLPRAGDRTARLERHLDRAELPEPLHALLRQMLDADPSARPTMTEVAARIGAIGADHAGLAAYASELAHEAATPLSDPQAHPCWPELAFLEQEEPAAVAAPLATDEAERAVRAVMKRPDWTDRIPELDALFERAEEPPIRPLMEVLDRASPPWWTPWIRASRPEELSAALLLLCDRATPPVVDRARALADHPEASVQAAARFLLGQRSGG